MILQWNGAVLAAMKQDASAPLLAARGLAIVHLAMRDAVAETAGPEQDAEIAAISAGVTAAAALLPNHRAEFEALRTRQLGALGEPTGSAEALICGEKVACRVLDDRANDGCAMHVSYVPRTEPGQWRRTPPFFRLPELPQWAAKVRPFVLERPDQFRPAGPPALNSEAWAAAFNEVKSLGAKDSAARTPEQTAIARFWSDFSYTETPPGHWNTIACALAEERRLDVAESARLLALLNVAMTDAGIACWDAKFHFNFWRPVTAVARAAENGNPDTLPQADWRPLLNTPSHPEYPSGHGAFSGAAAVVLANVFGTDQLSFTVRSDTVLGAERRFTSLRDCALECGTSRVFGGIHYGFSRDDGIRLGEKAGEAVVQKMLPITSVNSTK